jgi:hypothetical protein
MKFKVCAKAGLQTITSSATMAAGAVALSLLIGAEARAAQSVSLGWNPEPSVAGYALYHGSASGNYSTRMDVGTNLIATVGGLTEGQTDYFVVTAYNVAGVEGPPSPEVSYLVPGLLVHKKGAQGSKSVQLNFAVAPGHSYQIEASTDLASWAVIWTSGTATSNAWTTFQEPFTNSLRQKFYRLKMH